jgi:HAMP domain-containing protein
MAERVRKEKEEKEKDKGRTGGISMRTRFALMMSAALALVMAGAGLLLIRNASTISADVQETTLAKAALLSATAADSEGIARDVDTELRVLTTFIEMLRSRGGEKTTEDAAARIKQLEAYRKGMVPPWSQVEGDTADLEGGRVKRMKVQFGDQSSPATLYRVARADTVPFNLLVAEAAAPTPGKALLGTIIGTVVLVILVGAGVSVWVAGQVSGPMEELVNDIRQISTGDLKHRTHAHGSDELVSLARAIDRMTKNLAEARETELALSIRDRELEVAAEVREALLPQTTPQLAGYEVGATHISSPSCGATSTTSSRSTAAAAWACSCATSAARACRARWSARPRAPICAPSSPRARTSSRPCSSSTASSRATSSAACTSRRCTCWSIRSKASRTPSAPATRSRSCASAQRTGKCA